LARSPEKLLAAAQQFADERGAFTAFGLALVALAPDRDLPSFGRLDASRPGRIGFEFLGRQWTLKQIAAHDVGAPTSLIALSYSLNAADYEDVVAIPFDRDGKLGPSGEGSPRSLRDEPAEALFGMIQYALTAEWK
jgi:hypothetical protein